MENNVTVLIERLIQMGIHENIGYLGYFKIVYYYLADLINELNQLTF